MSDIEPIGHPHGPGGHEPTEVRLRGILGFAVALVVVTAVLQIGLGYWMGSFSREERREIASRPARLRDDTGQYPAPHLQGNPGADMTRFRKEEDARLDEYGWVDRPGGIARLPVDRAIELLARRGLPTRPAEPAARREAP